MFDSFRVLSKEQLFLLYLQCVITGEWPGYLKIFCTWLIGTISSHWQNGYISNHLEWSETSPDKCLLVFMSRQVRIWEAFACTMAKTQRHLVTTTEKKSWWNPQKTETNTQCFPFLSPWEVQYLTDWHSLKPHGKQKDSGNLITSIWTTSKLLPILGFLSILWMSDQMSLFICWTPDPSFICKTFFLFFFQLFDLR